MITKATITFGVPKQDRTAQYRRFILDWLAARHEINAMQDEFHATFTQKFGGRSVATPWGGSRNMIAKRILEDMRKNGTLTRCRVRLGDSWKPGQPRWVYAYNLNLKGKR